MADEKKPRTRKTIAQLRAEHEKRIAACKAATEKAEASYKAWEIAVREKHEAALKALDSEA